MKLIPITCLFLLATPVVPLPSPAGPLGGGHAAPHVAPSTPNENLSVLPHNSANAPPEPDNNTPNAPPEPANDTPVIPPEPANNTPNTPPKPVKDTPSAPPEPANNTPNNPPEPASTPPNRSANPASSPSPAKKPPGPPPPPIMPYYPPPPQQTGLNYKDLALGAAMGAAVFPFIMGGGANTMNSIFKADTNSFNSSSNSTSSPGPIFRHRNEFA